jgi:hypothetical protein
MGKYKQGNYLRPSDETSPSIKENDPGYSLDMSQYIYYLFDNDKAEITSSDRNRFDKTRLYAQGRQDTGIYKDLLLDNDRKDGPRTAAVDTDGKISETGRKGYMNVNFDDVFSPLPKLLNAIIGVLEGQEHNVFAQAIDENSLTLKEDIKSKAIIRGMFVEHLQKLNTLMGIDHKDQQPLPKNVKELELFESLGAFKLKYEIGIQKAVDHTLKLSKIRELKRRLIRDLITVGYACTEDYYDYNTGEIKLKYIDPRDLIIERSESPIFEDASFYGFVDYVTIFDLKHQTGLDDEELYKLAQNYFGKHGNSAGYAWETTREGYYEFYECRVPVLKSKWKTNDYEYRTKRKNQSGEMLDFPEPYRGKKIPKVYDKDNRKTYRISTRALYQASWVIGSEVVYDFGRVHDVPYDYKRKDIPLGVNIYKIYGKPIMESCNPIEDQIMLTHLRLQNAIAVSSPPGLAIEYNSLMGMSLENDEWSPLDVLRLKSQTGNLLFSVTPNGVDIPPNYPDPVKELHGGLGTAINDAISSFEMQFNSLRVITGIDDITVAGRPINDQGKAVTELAVSATVNTLKPVYSGYLAIKESMALSSLLRIQALLLTDQESVYQDVIGESAVAALKAVGSKSPVQLGVHLVASPDDQLKQEVRAAAQSALAGGKNGVPALKYSEYLFVIESLNTSSGIAAARMYIAMKESEKEQQEQQYAMRAQEKQSKEVQEQNRQKAEQELVKIKADQEKDISVINEKTKGDLAVEEAKHRFKMEQIRLEKSLEVSSIDKT